jgi:hypothetical protein
MAGASLYQSTPNGVALPYDKVLVSGLVGSLRANGINVNIANATYTSSSLVFDIQLQSDAYKCFHDAVIGISYNTTNFGTDVVANHNLTCNLALDSSIYTLSSLADSDANTFEIAVNGSFSWQGQYIAYGSSLPSLPYSLIETYTTIATCSLSVQSCCFSPNTPYLTSTFISADYSLIYLDMDSDPYDDYDDWFIDQYDNNPYTTGSLGNYTNANVNLCSPSIPDITDIYGPDSTDPLTIIAGSFDTLTIMGCGFGPSKGQVLFPDADNGGVGMMHTQLPDIQLWTDNMIKTWVPSIQDTNQHTAGTGQIQIVTASGDTSTYSGGALSLHIPYAVNNARAASTKRAYPYLLQSIDTNQGYVFTPAYYITGDTLAAITKAMNDWACQIGIRFTIGPPTNTPVVNGHDSINTILYGTLSSYGMLTLINGVLYTSPPPAPCSNSLPTGVVTDIDIIINSSSIFFLSMNDTTTVPSGQHSLMGEARHEFGHAAGLKHVINLADVMYYKDPGSGKPPAQIHHDDQNGGIHELQLGTIYLAAGCYSPQIYPDSCPTLTIINSIANLNSSTNKISVYPNPFDNDIIINADIGIESEMNVTIYDLLGQIMSYNDFGMVSDDVKEIIPTSTFGIGIYIIKVSVGDNNFLLKMVKTKN